MQRINKDGSPRKKMVPRSKEWSDKISASKKGVIFTDEHKKNIRLSALGRVPWNKGLAMSKEQREKLSAAHIGKRRTAESINKTKVGLLGKKRPIDVCQKISQSRKGLRYNIGNAHWNWQGGKTEVSMKARNSYEQKEWRLGVFERDNFTCIKCGQIGGEIEAHHIFNFSDYQYLRTEVDNGITLCKKCHKLFHKKYGRKNNVKEQLEKFLINNL